MSHPHEDGRILITLQRASRNWPVARDVPTTAAPTSEQVNRGLWLLENAQHSYELRLLDRRVLVELCDCKLKVPDVDVDYETVSKSSLVAQLSDWVRIPWQDFIPT